MKNKILILFTLPFLMTSCEKVFFKDEIAPTPTNTFEYLWQKTDEQYSFFDIKNVDWDSIHQTYSPFVTDDIDDDSLFSVLSSMMATLRDGHVNVFSPFSTTFDEDVIVRMYDKSNIDENLVNLNYLFPNHFYSDEGMKSVFLRDGKVAYVRYSSFSNGLSDNALKTILNRFSNTEGMILDLRQNGGGLVNNVTQLLRFFTTGRHLMYATQIKTGPAHNDFSGYDLVYSPNDSTVPHYDKNVIVLIDRGSYSATSFFSTTTKAFDHLILVGDTTGGGLGLPNGGQLPNGWCYRLSITRTLDINGNNYENGVPPDSVVILNQASVDAGFDNVIETACDMLLNL